MERTSAETGKEAAAAAHPAQRVVRRAVAAPEFLPLSELVPGMALMFDNSLTLAQQAELNAQLPAGWQVPLSQRAAGRVSAEQAAGLQQQGMPAPAAGPGQGINEEDPDNPDKADDSDAWTEWDGDTDSDGGMPWMDRPPQGDGAVPTAQQAVQNPASAMQWSQQQLTLNAVPAAPVQLQAKRQLSATSLRSEAGFRVGYEDLPELMPTAPADQPRGGSG